MSDARIIIRLTAEDANGTHGRHVEIDPDDEIQAVTIFCMMLRGYHLWRLRETGAAAGASGQKVRESVLPKIVTWINGGCGEPQPTPGAE